MKMNRLDKLKKELKDPSLHFRHECEGFRCGAHKSWEEGFDAASAEYEKIIAELEGALAFCKSELVAINNYDETRYKHMTAWQEIDKSQKKLKEFRG